MALAQPGTAQPAPGPETGPLASDDPRWAVRLGARVAMEQRLIPVVDRVVLVPDEATYADELRHWSLEGRWPVLIEDDLLAPMFIRRFQPAQVIRREPAGAWAAEPAERRRVLESIVVSAWGGAAGQGPRDAFAALGFVPPGVVIANPDDPAWTAAVALAAGHGQPLAWLEGRFPGPDELLNLTEARALMRGVDEIVARQGYAYGALGDQIDAITLCMAVGVRMLQTPYPASQIVLPGADIDTVGPVATSDQLGRHESGERYAITGQIFGTQASCAYAAMCALFLERRQVVLVDTYPPHRNFDEYRVERAGLFLDGLGYEARAMSGPGASEMGWQRSLPGGLSADVLMMGTRGPADRFGLYTGEAYAGDVPTLNTPAALHLVHSWAMRSPGDRETVGGRFLERGAYAAVAACHEPLLGAFLPHELLARRLSSFVPFLVAGRRWDGPFAAPWRVVTLGDPLMLAAPPQADAPQRRSWPAERGLDLRQRAAQLLEQVRDQPREEAAAEAMACLVLLGRDNLALDLWRLARQAHVERKAARSALGPLFRGQMVDEFVAAWGMSPRRAATDDMLWHLLAPRLGPACDRETLALLESAVRGPAVHVDLDRLLPWLRRARGPEHVRALIEHHLTRTERDDVRGALEGMRRDNNP